MIFTVTNTSDAESEGSLIWPAPEAWRVLTGFGFFLPLVFVTALGISMGGWVAAITLHAALALVATLGRIGQMALVASSNGLEIRGVLFLRTLAKDDLTMVSLEPHRGLVLFRLSDDSITDFPLGFSVATAASRSRADELAKRLMAVWGEMPPVRQDALRDRLVNRRGYVTVGSRTLVRTSTRELVLLVGFALIFLVAAFGR